MCRDKTTEYTSAKLDAMLRFWVHSIRYSTVWTGKHTHTRTQCCKGTFNTNAIHTLV